MEIRIKRTGVSQVNGDPGAADVTNTYRVIDDGREFSELIRERTAKLLGPDDELLTRGPPSTWDPAFKVMWDKLLAAAMAAKGKR